MFVITINAHREEGVLSLLDFSSPLSWDPSRTRIKMPLKCQQGNGSIIHRTAIHSGKRCWQLQPFFTSSSLSTAPENATAFHVTYPHIRHPCKLKKRKRARFRGRESISFFIGFETFFFLQDCHLNNAESAGSI